jgi:hypothetical protein
MPTTAGSTRLKSLPVHLPRNAQGDRWTGRSGWLRTELPLRGGVANQTGEQDECRQQQGSVHGFSYMVTLQVPGFVEFSRFQK